MTSFMKRPLAVLIESLAAAALLSACGGGGGSTSEAVDTGTTQVADANAGTGSPAATDEGAAAPDAVADGGAAAAEGEADAAAPSGEEPERDPAESLARAEAIASEQPPVEDDPGTTPTEDPASADRESALALTIDSGDRGYAKPKVAALDYENNNTTTRRDHLAKFKFVILGARAGNSSLGTFANSIKSKSPSTKIAYYTMFNELKCSASSSSYYYPMVQAANSGNFWLRYASGSKAQWTSSYDACDMNISKWGRTNSAGRTWVQEKARFDHDKVFDIPAIDHVFSDNTFFRPRVDADWKRIGTNQSRNLSDIQSAQRAGHVAYWNAIKARRSSLKIIANADRDLSHAEYVDKAQGAFMEGAMGRSWSLETWAGWGPMMDRYRGLIRNTAAPNDVFFQVYGSNSNYKLMRYGLASALMHNGWYVYLPSSGTLKSGWYDDYDAPLGKAVDAPPTAPKSNGIWARKYENGIVLVNPKSSSASINVGTGYKRLKGSQDPSVNNGQAQTTVTLPAKSGLIMIRR